MGQCMSRKAAGAFAASAAAVHTRPSSKMHKNHLKSPDDDDNNKEGPIKKSPDVSSKGVSMSFGFKRRPTTAPSIATNASVGRRLASSTDVIDRNGNGGVTNDNGDADTELLTSNIAPTGRSTPRLVPPKKEANATKISRFGFRQPHVNRLNKVADLNNGGAPNSFVRNNNSSNNNVGVVKLRQNQQQIFSQNKFRSIVTGNPHPTSTTVSGNTTDNNRNRMVKTDIPQTQFGKFTLHSTQFPKLEKPPLKLIESKSAKTLANNSKKVSSSYHHHHHHEDNNSSKDGSLTEDSGVSSHFSTGGGYEWDNLQINGFERLESSPTFGVRRSFTKPPRNLEVLVSGNKFDVRDLDDSSENCVPLPQLPSAFHHEHSDNKNNSSYHNNGIVRERTIEYQRLLDKDHRRKISITSSEGFSDDYCDETKTYSDKFNNEKSTTFLKPSHKSFLKVKNTSSTQSSSDEQEWLHGGEAMADDVSFSFSSSDESKDHHHPPITTISGPNIASAFHNLMSSSLHNSLTQTEIRNVLLTIEDPKFAAVIAASDATTLLDEETSPLDSLMSSESDDILLKKKLTSRSSSNSKDINEKLTPPSPGTPTNASNSLSLSDGGKDDFLIDDEIADQPALVFEDTITNINCGSSADPFTISQSNSDNTHTIVVDSTPKPRRRGVAGFEGSPLVVRNKKFLHSRTGSLDTLSPCESIASDDLMMDFDYSQSSGMEDFDKTDRQSSGYPSLDETIVTRGEFDLKKPEGLRDWSSLLGNYAVEKSTSATTNNRPSRLLKSRTSTPSSIPDSPRSLDRHVRPRPSLPNANSPLRPPRSGTHSGYDSDDSIRLDRACHTAMKQDMMSIKTMLLKLRRVLNEQVDEDLLMRSETHNPFDDQANLTNGLFNGLSSTNHHGDVLSNHDESSDEHKLELSELRKQVLFLQGQLEDKEKVVQSLQDEMIQISNANYTSNSAPASSTVVDTSCSMCNAATQTERIRPISAGPSLLNGSPVESTASSLVSVTETTPQRKSRPPLQGDSSSSSSPRRTPSRLWRKPGEPPSPQRYTTTSTTPTSSIPRRANSRTRAPSIPS